MNYPYPFDRIQRLLRASKDNRVLSMLLDAKKGRIKKPYTTDLYLAWYVIGDILYVRSDYTDALSAFKKSYRHWKENVPAINDIGLCYLEMGNPKTAKYYFTKARAIGGTKYKNKGVVTYNLGNAYFDMREYTPAISEYKKVKVSDKTVYKLAQQNVKQAKEILKSKKG